MSAEPFSLCLCVPAQASKPPKPKSAKSTPSPRDDVVEAFPTDKAEPQVLI